ncbi:hypothetical protein AWB67_01327 [Caballeronia terrestris]|uniref:Uncharacterized protein n=1 Tax=Caballeronia terrestris TaxID=1226301 RepID=A0A158GKU6_9BURK|nr:hypothetical protein [Caballeronia terrestris]SAL32652.1 hypothetical protein AWB67_01327 [Caballeronia terrestris]
MEALKHPGASLVLDAATLLDLWHRRASLTQAEMAQIYQLVRLALRSYHPSELRALPEGKEELIAQFIFSRVLRLDADRAVSHACAESAPSTVYALCAYFRRYLIDCLRSASVQRNVSLEVDDMAARIDAHARSLADPIASALAEHGLTEASVRASARLFVGSLDVTDRVILSATLGANRGCKGGLRSVASEHEIPSYHYRARKLGVTKKKTETPAGFGTTKIGGWLATTLGIALTFENRDAILIALNLLALEVGA